MQYDWPPQKRTVIRAAFVDCLLRVIFGVDDHQVRNGAFLLLVPRVIRNAHILTIEIEIRTGPRAIVFQLQDRLFFAFPEIKQSYLPLEYTRPIVSIQERQFPIRIHEMI